MAKFFFLAILLFFLAAFFLSGSIYLNYPFPMIVDSWDHVAIAGKIVSTQSLMPFEPYYLANGIEKAGSNPEFGFHALSAAIAVLFGFDMVFVSIIVPTLATFLLALGVFVLVRRFAKNNLTALLSTMAVLTIKSGMAMLGFQYFVPMALGLALMPSIIFMFFNSRNSKKFTLLFFFTIFSTTLIYPPFVVLLFPLFLIGFLQKPVSRFFLTLSTLFILMVFFIYSGFLLKGESNMLNLVNSFFFNSFSFSESKLDILTALNPIVLMFSLLGFAVVAFMKSDFVEKFSLIVEAIALLLFFLLFKFTGISFPAPAARILSAFSLIAAIFAGIGIHFALTKFFEKKFFAGVFHVFGKTFDKKAFATTLLCVGFFSTALYLNWFDSSKAIGLNEYFEGEHGIKLLHESELNALNFLKSNAENSVILSPAGKGRVVHAFTGLKVSPVPAARLGTPNQKLLQQINLAFEQADCESIFSNLKKFKAKFIYLPKITCGHTNCFKEVSCQNISKIYSMKSESQEVGIYLKEEQ